MEPPKLSEHRWSLSLESAPSIIAGQLCLHNECLVLRVLLKLEDAKILQKKYQYAPELSVVLAQTRVGKRVADEQFAFMRDVLAAPFTGRFRECDD